MDKILNEDISLAQQIVSRQKLPERHVFSDISGIYKGTNEEMATRPYIDAIRNKKRILSVIASGDQIINSILLGSKDIEGYDISRFPKYYLMLKLAALKALNKEEYLNFFLGDVHNELFSEDLYAKLYPELDESARMFWDSLFDYFDACELNESMLFRSDIMNKTIMIRNNPYLNGPNYDIVKEKIKDAKIKFQQGNIFELINSNMKGFNLVNLSNIIHYYKVENKDYSSYKKFIESIPLKNDGIVLTYLISFNPFWKSRGITHQFNDSHYQSIPLKATNPCDGLILYKKRGVNSYGKH